MGLSEATAPQTVKHSKQDTGVPFELYYEPLQSEAKMRMWVAASRRADASLARSVRFSL
jgi:hypothetical protein